jgi:hypothetical protein
MSYRIAVPLALLIVGCAVAWAQPKPAEVVITFDKAEIGKAIPSWTDKGVVFTSASNPKRGKAVGRIMFFPHLNTDRKGILNAMAAEAIPVQVRFPNGASSVTLVLWGSVANSALVEAFDKDGKLVDKAFLASVPTRESPADAVPTFELTVKAPEIASIRFGGSRAGGHLVANEVRFTPLPAPAK